LEENFCYEKYDPDKKLYAEENVAKYLTWVKKNYPSKLLRIISYIKKRNEGYPTMSIKDYNIHHDIVKEYLQQATDMDI
jgi:3-methyladenine DNA glycosylase AlkC